MSGEQPDRRDATAKVWSLGKTWQVHAKHPDGRWIRVTGLSTETEAIWTGDALVEKLDAEARP